MKIWALWASSEHTPLTYLVIFGPIMATKVKQKVCTVKQDVGNVSWKLCAVGQNRRKFELWGLYNKPPYAKCGQ